MSTKQIWAVDMCDVHIQWAAVATHRLTPMQREDRDRHNVSTAAGMLMRRTWARRGWRTVVRECHSKQTQRLLTVCNWHDQPTSLQASWLLKHVLYILKPATGDISSWVTGDFISWPESNWDGPVYSAATFLCHVLNAFISLCIFGLNWALDCC